MWLNKKLALTGHTSGIGRQLFEDRQQKGLPVIGFSRSNGFDISDPAARASLISKIADCDVFINNATLEWAQVDLFYELFEEWKMKEKLILNIGSQSSRGIKNYLHKYAVQKAALDKAVEQTQVIPGTLCRTVILQPSWVRTPRVKDCVTSDPFMSAERVVEFINWILALPREVHVSHLAFEGRPEEPSV